MSARRILGRAAWVLSAVVVLAAAALVIWSQAGVYTAEEEAAASVRANPEITVSEDAGSLTLAPTSGQSGAGLVFIPGAKVEALAYAAKLQGLAAEEGMTVVITKPWLNLAFFDPRPLDSFTASAEGVRTWTVGGHSLGGVRACQLAGDADGLVLFASYCSADLAEADLPVLSLAGSEDGLSTPRKVADARDRLPADAVLIEIAGAAHSSFGDYGPQEGDGVPTISDEAVTEEITRRIGDLAAAQ